mmetsp:Transcript_24625/g.71986  ORF Transcript_24625/g.71986 Transcript_24625/m.71986 type:complete len:211 (-) Transcript_24625:25-657(-)
MLNDAPVPIVSSNVDERSPRVVPVPRVEVNHARPAQIGGEHARMDAVIDDPAEPLSVVHGVVMDGRRHRARRRLVTVAAETFVHAKEVGYPRCAGIVGVGNIRPIIRYRIGIIVGHHRRGNCCGAGKQPEKIGKYFRVTKEKERRNPEGICKFSSSHGSSIVLATYASSLDAVFGRVRGGGCRKQRKSGCNGRSRRLVLVRPLTSNCWRY